MSGIRRFVHVRKNTDCPPRYYTGLTADVHARLAKHHQDGCLHTASGVPWQVDVVIEFADEARAVRFARYLKSGSGHACAKRHVR
jgi:predicted GIY-YIG superfamily endonuclease